MIVIACDGVGDLDALAHAGKEAVEGLEQEEALALEDLCEFGQMGGMSALSMHNGAPSSSSPPSPAFASPPSHHSQTAKAWWRGGGRRAATSTVRDTRAVQQRRNKGSWHLGSGEGEGEAEVLDVVLLDLAQTLRVVDAYQV